MIFSEPSGWVSMAFELHTSGLQAIARTLAGGPPFVSGVTSVFSLFSGLNFEMRAHRHCRARHRFLVFLRGTVWSLGKTRCQSRQELTRFSSHVATGRTC